MSVPSDANVLLKIFEKLSKYKDVEIEVTKMWHLKTTTLPVVIGALGTVAKITCNYVFQKITLMGTAKGTIKVISCERYYQCNLYIYIYIYICRR